MLAVLIGKGALAFESGIPFFKSFKELVRIYGLPLNARAIFAFLESGMDCNKYIRSFLRLSTLTLMTFAR